MAMIEGVRPTDWRERMDAETFAGWIKAPAPEVRLAPLFALVMTVPVALYPFAFGDRVTEPMRTIVVPLVLGLMALAFWCRVLVLHRPPVRFRVARGRLILQKSAIPWLGIVSLPLDEVAAVRTAPRKFQGKLLKFELWDVIVDARDGTEHCVTLSRVVADEATWIARRVASAAGVAR